MPRFRPHVESLENRSCPAAPVISLSVAAAGNSMVNLSGVVQDEAPAFMWITFSGAYQGSTQTDANGAFSVTVTPGEVGTVFASVVDEEMYYAEASAELQNAMPMILDFIATHGAGTIWTFSGRVVDEAPEGLEVELWGLPSVEGLKVSVAADGTFSITVELAEGEDGYVQAWVQDWWHQMAEASTVVDCIT
jgi:hypothetical protein